MPTFCRHNRFIERCPICSKTLPGNEPPARTPQRAPEQRRARARGTRRRARRRAADGLRVHREGRAADDGYARELVPGPARLRRRPAPGGEIAFSSARLPRSPRSRRAPTARRATRPRAATSSGPPGSCFLLAYLSPLPRASSRSPGVRGRARRGAEPRRHAASSGTARRRPRGPRSSHEPGSGTRDAAAYAQWAERAGGAGGGLHGRRRRGRPSAASSACSNGSRCPGSAARALRAAGDARPARRSTSCAPTRCTGRRAARRARTRRRWPPSACSGSATRCCSSAAPRRWPRPRVPLEALDLALFNWASPASGRRSGSGRSSDRRAERAGAALGL